MIAPLFGSITRPLLSPLVSGLRDELFGAFTPRSLFNDGSIGVLYDNNDLTTMFLDAAGTTPATVNGLVGLQLDKSQGLVLGAERLTNGDFSSATGWTVSATAPATASISGGVLTFNSPAGEAVTVTQSAFTVGKWYEVRVVATAVGGGGFRLFAGTGAVGEGRYDIFSPGTYVVRLLANGSDGVLYISRLGASSATIDSISVKELPGNHRYQTTTGSKPILRGTPTGSNLVTNGDFASGTGWTVNSGWAIGSGTLNATAVTAGYGKAVFAGATITAGKVYRITFTITARTAGGVGVALGAGASYTVGTARTAVGTYVEYITAGFNGAVEFERRSADFTGSIDNVEVVDVSAGSVTAPYGLQYDGVDDFLQTASVNFSATDKMFVCAGVRKFSDSVGAVIASLGNVASVAGSFELNGPGTAAPNYVMQLRGNSSNSIYFYTTYAAPVTNVISVALDYAAAVGSEAVARVNGVTPTTATGVESGAGPFANQIMYFGRRTGTVSPYNGLDFGFVIVGKTLTAAQISSTERWMAQRTGVSI